MDRIGGSSRGLVRTLLVVWAAWLPLAVPAPAAAQTAGKAGKPAPSADARDVTRSPAPVTSLEVSVSDAAGRPLEGALVIATPVTGAYLPYGGLRKEKLRSSLTGSDGKAKLDSLPRGPWTIAVHARGLLTRTVPRVSAGPLGVRLEKGGAITGMVREGEGGRPLPGARVGLEGGALPESWQDEAMRVEATSEGDGAFLIAGLKVGRHEVTASAPGYATARVKAEAGGAPIVLAMDLGGEIAGRVVDAQGQPVEDAQIEGEPADEPGWGIRHLWGRADEGDGRFLLRDVAAGTYVLQARASGRGEAAATRIAVSAGKTTNVGTLMLARGGVVQGSVVDAEGRGIPGATIQVEKEANMWTGQHQAQSDSSGAFEVRGVPPGSLNVMASHPGYAPGRPVVADVDPEKEPAAVRIVLLRGTRIEGRATRRDDVERFELDLEIASSILTGMVVDRETGQPVPEASVGLFERGEPRGAGKGNATVGPDGRFSIAVEPGEYRLEAGAPGWKRTSIGVSAGDGIADLRVELERGATVSGRVVDIAGRPASGLQVEAVDTTGEIAAEAESLADGPFRDPRARGAVAHAHDRYGARGLRDPPRRDAGQRAGHAHAATGGQGPGPGVRP